MREGVYALSVLVCAVVNPAFLLVDVRASVSDTTGGLGYAGLSFLVMYVIAPEKYVVNALFQRGGLAQLPLVDIARTGGGLLDACGLGALGAGLGAANLPQALAVGYIVTGLGALWIVVGALVNSLLSGSEADNENFRADAMRGIVVILVAFVGSFTLAATGVV